MALAGSLELGNVHEQGQTLVPLPQEMDLSPLVTKNCTSSELCMKNLMIEVHIEVGSTLAAGRGVGSRVVVFLGSSLDHTGYGAPSA